MSTETITLLPRCDRCGVEYIESYEGPCQEYPAWATDNQIAHGDTPRCGGSVSWFATAKVLHDQLEEAKP